MANVLQHRADSLKESTHQPGPVQKPTGCPSRGLLVIALTRSQLIRAMAVVGLLVGLVPALWAQDTPSLSHWEKELARQTDSTRKAEVLLFIAKDMEPTNPTGALAYAQQAYDLGEKLKAPKVSGLAALQLSKLHALLGNKAKARRFRKRAEETLRSVDLMAELSRLETGKSQAEETAQANAEAAATSRQVVSQLSTETQQKQAMLARQEKKLSQRNQQLRQQGALIGQKDQLIGQKDSMLTTRELMLRFQQDQIKILEGEKALKAAEAEQERTVRNALLMGAGFLLLLAGLLWRLIANKQRANRELAQKNNQLDLARQRSDELLLNILPGELVDELKVKGITRTRHHDEVTIMFTDFRDFTKISEQLSPVDLVQEIDYCFRHFDYIIGKYPSLEKIKTIGDAYLCAGGLPAAHPSHAHEMVMAALEIRDFIGALEKQRAREGKVAFQVRIGVHTGPVIAGVVGATKFAYDIWGDTVNTASRLESASEPGQVNISEATYERVQTHFSCRHRGEIATKNKANMSMYFVDSQQTTAENLVYESINYAYETHD